jgi:hypothetical protein
VLPDASNAEIVRVTAIAGDHLTIVRQQEGTAARAILVGDVIAAAITAKTLTDIEDAASTALSAAGALAAAVNVVSNALSVETTARLTADAAETAARAKLMTRCRKG